MLIHEYMYNLPFLPLQLGSSFHSPTTLPTSPSKDRNAGDRFIPSRMGNNWDVDYNVVVSINQSIHWNGFMPSILEEKCLENDFSPAEGGLDQTSSAIYEGRRARASSALLPR